MVWSEGFDLLDQFLDVLADGLDVSGLDFLDKVLDGVVDIDSLGDLSLDLSQELDSLVVFVNQDGDIVLEGLDESRDLVVEHDVQVLKIGADVLESAGQAVQGILELSDGSGVLEFGDGVLEVVVGPLGVGGKSGNVLSLSKNGDDILDPDGHGDVLLDGGDHVSNLLSDAVEVLCLPALESGLGVVGAISSGDNDIFAVVIDGDLLLEVGGDLLDGLGESWVNSRKLLGEGCDGGSHVFVSGGELVDVSVLHAVLELRKGLLQ